MNRRGFTLVELMVALAIASVSVVVAARVAQTVIKQSAKGRQRTDVSVRAAVLGAQLREDIRMAGFASSGAIAVNTGAAPFVNMGFNTPANRAAMPALVVASNIGGTALNIQPGSDAIQMVVPDPVTARHVGATSQAGGTLITLTAGEAPFGCAQPFVYVVDYTAGNGVGRTQLLRLGGVVGTAINTLDGLRFTVPPEAEVLCARISTYWVDATGWLRRSDVTGAPTVVVPSVAVPLVIDAAAVNTQVAPGILDFQLAVRVSAEVYRNAGLAVPGAGAPPASQWAFAGEVGNVDAQMSNPGLWRNWFEVRAVRLNLLSRRLRVLDGFPDIINVPRREDANAAVLPVRRSFNPDWFETAESLVNLRYFDLGAPVGVAAEPF